MTPLLARLELTDFLVIAVIVFLFTCRSLFAARQSDETRRLERKLDALLKHHGIEEPPGILLPSGRLVSFDVQCLAKDPRRKIAAIRVHREQNPGLGLAEAKADIEAFIVSAK